MLSSRLLNTLSNTPPTALKDTLSACFTISTQESSQDAPKHLLSMLPSTLPSCSQVLLPVWSQVRSQLHSMVHSQATSVYAPKYTLKMANTLKREDTPNLTWGCAPKHVSACSIPGVAELLTVGIGRHEAVG